MTYLNIVSFSVITYWLSKQTCANKYFNNRFFVVHFRVVRSLECHAVACADGEYIMLSVSRILAAVSVLLLFGLTANKGYAAEPFEALVIGLEYPPFVSMKVPGYGKAVRALRHRLPENWQIRMRMLPSARASTILRNSDE